MTADFSWSVFSVPVLLVPPIIRFGGKLSGMRLNNLLHSRPHHSARVRPNSLNTTRTATNIPAPMIDFFISAFSCSGFETQWLGVFFSAVGINRCVRLSILRSAGRRHRQQWDTARQQRCTYGALRLSVRVGVQGLTGADELLLVDLAPRESLGEYLVGS
jgi:hypothetical protein